MTIFDDAAGSTPVNAAFPANEVNDVTAIEVGNIASPPLKRKGIESKSRNNQLKRMGLNCCPQAGKSLCMLGGSRRCTGGCQGDAVRARWTAT